jgi:hypothetical protein
MTKGMQRIMMLLKSAIHQIGLGMILKVQANFDCSVGTNGINISAIDLGSANGARGH